MVRDKVRIRFRKDGALRLVSHHDLMRCFERMLRRAALPFHSTQGFNPRPRLVFALSLALGIVGGEEVAELEMDEDLPVEEIQERLGRQAPAGLTIRSIRRIDSKAKAQVRRVCYRIALPTPSPEDLNDRIDTVLAASHCWIERTRPEARRIDIRPYLRGLHAYPDVLEIDLWVSPQGGARPDEVLGLLGLSALLEAGAVLERTLMELHDECREPEPGSGAALVLAGASTGAPAPIPDSPDVAGTPSCEHIAVPPRPNTQAEGNA